MARITVEDCIKQVRNQYELVILAKERAVQLGRGAAPAVDPENDKKPVIALREIGESKITPQELHESILGKLRQISDYQEEDIDNVEDDSFRQMYQGGLSKSEMEKTATRKFTSRTPRIETKHIITEEAVTEEASNDLIEESLEVQSDALEISSDQAEKNVQEDEVEISENEIHRHESLEEEIDNNS